MKRLRKLLIGDRKFYKMVLLVAVPIMIQNGITNFVSLLDNIMVGRVGTEQMSGVAIVNQMILVFNLCIFGCISAAVKSTIVLINFFSPIHFAAVVICLSEIFITGLILSIFPKKAAAVGILPDLAAYFNS